MNPQEDTICLQQADISVVSKESLAQLQALHLQLHLGAPDVVPPPLPETVTLI